MGLRIPFTNYQIDPTPGFNAPGINDLKSVVGKGGVANPGSASKVSGMNTKNGGQGQVKGESTATTAPAPVNDPYNENDDRNTGAGYAAEIGQITAQDALLGQMLNKLMSSYNQGYRNIDDSYNRGKVSAEDQNARAMRDFDVKTQDTTDAKGDAIGKVDTNARTLANSLRRMIGMASGSGSSAYQVTAPDAVNRKASLERGEVQEDFGRNFRDLDIAKKDTASDFEKLLQELSAQRDTARREFETGLGEQINQVQGQRHDLLTQRRAYEGGNAAQIAAAGAPLRADIASRNTSLDSLFEKYRSPVAGRDLSVKTPELRDYTVDRAGINAADTAQKVDPYANYLRPKEEDELI